MSPEEFAKADLLIRREDLERRLAAIERNRRHNDPQQSTESRDRAVEGQNDEVLDRLEEATRRELQQLQHALERIEACRYGVCEHCHEPIPLSRLKAIPEATSCAACAAAIAVN